MRGAPSRTSRGIDRIAALRQPALAASPKHWSTARLRELKKCFGPLQKFAAQAHAENITKAYAADLEDFRHWCKKCGRKRLPAGPETIALYLGPRANDLSLSMVERRLASMDSFHKDEGYESPAWVAENPLRKIWKSLVREKTGRQNGARHYWSRSSNRLSNTCPATRAPMTDGLES